MGVRRERKVGRAAGHGSKNNLTSLQCMTLLAGNSCECLDEEEAFQQNGQARSRDILHITLFWCRWMGILWGDGFSCKGFKQGFSLAPLLSVLVMDSLAICTTQAGTCGLLRAHPPESNSFLQYVVGYFCRLFGPSNQSRQISFCCI